MNTSPKVEIPISSFSINKVTPADQVWVSRLLEDILETARREIFEETGYESYNHELLYSYYPANGNTNIRFYITFCQVGERCGVVDTGEISEIRWMNRKDIAVLLQEGELQDGFTLSAVLYWWWSNP